MGNKVKVKRRAGNKENQKPNSNKGSLIILGVIAFLLVGLLFTRGGSGPVKPLNYAQLEGDLKIVKSEITADAKFYPFKLGDTNMEVLALKAEDGTIRTALNTCQVCYGSGKGYYIQEPNTKELICQNCGNRFGLNQVEVVKGGCNPIPIMKENKTDDGANIIISKEILEESKILFSRWTKG